MFWENIFISSKQSLCTSNFLNNKALNFKFPIHYTKNLEDRARSPEIIKIKIQKQLDLWSNEETGYYYRTKNVKYEYRDSAIKVGKVTIEADRKARRQFLRKEIILYVNSSTIRRNEL